MQTEKLLVCGGASLNENPYAKGGWRGTAHRGEVMCYIHRESSVIKEKILILKEHEQRNLKYSDIICLLQIGGVELWQNNKQIFHLFSWFLA